MVQKRESGATIFVDETVGISALGLGDNSENYFYDGDSTIVHNRRGTGLLSDTIDERVNPRSWRPKGANTVR